jgi:protein-tyrosine phosphatase
MIDFHTHILPGLDDGPISVDDSILMAKALKAFGYRTVCCTPHYIHGDYEFSAQQIREATLMLQADLDNESIQLELWPGMEYMLDEAFLDLDELLPLGKTRLVLCEAQPQEKSHTIFRALEAILNQGFVPLIAHPERTPVFLDWVLSSKKKSLPATPNRKVQRPSRLQQYGANLFKSFFSGNNQAIVATRASNPTSELRLEDTVLFHANLGSFTGYYGPDVQRHAYELLRLGTFSALASDLHDSQAAPHILVREKFENNPLLSRIAAFDGQTMSLDIRGTSAESQFDLFSH